MELTNREKEVLKLLVQGYFQKDIARQLGLSISRVQDIKSSIRKKWGVESEMQFFLTALKKGYFDADLDSWNDFSGYVSSTTIKSRVLYYYSPSK